MQLKDIDDRRVVQLAHDWQKGAPEGVVAALVTEGVPRKLAVAKVEQLESKRLLESGVSSNYAWPTPAGEALLAQEA